jgi:gas vesicle protein
MIKRLQDENVSFSDAVNKLNEINIKLKKECVLISSEYKKLTESSREKKRVIEKQKKVIELLQSKLGENFNSPLEEIKSKMSNLKLDIEKEKDPEKRERLKKSFEDTSKRLEDFEAVLNKKKSENTKILQ